MAKITKAEEHQKRLDSFIKRWQVKTENGKLVLYKAVRGDLGSWYMRDSRRNKRNKKAAGGVYVPGTEVICRRFSRDPSQCCASGLHVSTRGFAMVFMPSAPVILRVLVDPEDVVCVPDGWLTRKIRVRRLYVDAVVAGKRKCTYDFSDTR